MIQSSLILCKLCEHSKLFFLIIVFIHWYFLIPYRYHLCHCRLYFLHLSCCLCPRNLRDRQASLAFVLNEKLIKSAKLLLGKNQSRQNVGVLTTGCINFKSTVHSYSSLDVVENIWKSVKKVISTCFINALSVSSFRQPTTIWKL